MAVLNYITLAATETAEQAAEAATSGGLGAIGLDWRSLVFQLINFALLFWLLKKVAYKPILRVLDDRRQRIDESLAQARQIEQTSRQTAAAQAALLQQARQEADAILSRSREEAAALLKRSEAQAGAKAQQVLEQAQERIEQELGQARISLKHELAGLVIAATGAVIHEKLDEDKDADLIKRALTIGDKKQ
ncbi:MAG TPA: F0F1 ATP synthase subunit B [Candidatus Saccharimonadales bacterium]|nr:F0F1 ATP synthase subunit B [Candidatus Saccharimonadales bacterium]